MTDGIGVRRNLTGLVTGTRLLLSIFGCGPVSPWYYIGWVAWNLLASDFKN